MQQTGSNSRKRRWTRLLRILPLFLGFASCDICGASTRLNNTNRCTDFNFVSATGLPYGPATITFTPSDGMSQYRITVYSNTYGVMGDGVVTPPANSITLNIDKTVADKTLAGDGIFAISGDSALEGVPVGECLWDASVSFKPKAKKAAPTQAPTATLPPAAQACQLQRFTADQTNLRLNPTTGTACTTLHWDVEGVNMVYLNGTGVVGHGSQQVCIKQTSQYTLTLKCNGGDKSSTVTLSVSR